MTTNEDLNPPSLVQLGSDVVVKSVSHQTLQHRWPVLGKTTVHQNTKLFCPGETSSLMQRLSIGQELNITQCQRARLHEYSFTSFACQSICSPLLSIIHLSTYVFIYHFSFCPNFFVDIACLTYVQYPSLFSLPLFLTFWSSSPGAHSSHALNIFKFNVIIDRGYASLQLPHLLPQGTTLLADEVSYRTSPEVPAGGQLSGHKMSRAAKLRSSSCTAKVNRTSWQSYLELGGSQVGNYSNAAIT